MEAVKLIIIGTVLLIQSVCDIKWKKIPLMVTGFGCCLGIGFAWMNQKALSELFFAILPGVLCLLFAAVSQEAMGYGDALLLCMLGLFYGAEEMLRLLLPAFALAFLAALFLLVVFKKKRKYEMAFVPFLAVSYMIDLWLRMKGISL